MIDVVGKLWGICHTLRHDGVHDGEYVEQITYLLFLKMSHEHGKISLPRGCSWARLLNVQGSALTAEYGRILRTLGATPGILHEIYEGAQVRIGNPVALEKVIRLIDEVQWSALPTDVQGDAYEGLLEKAAAEGKKGAGQYFTPRVLIQSIVRCMRPDPRATSRFTVCDPACGTAGFLVAAYEWFAQHCRDGKPDLWRRVRERTYFGQELVNQPRRLGLMNLYVHGVQPTITLGDSIEDAPPEQRFDLVMTNPPFGVRGVTKQRTRADFFVQTNDKQLNFVQHVHTILADGGRAAIVLPDSCLFSDKAGELFDQLVQSCNVHTILRLPNGTFAPYAAGVRANVLFFTKGVPTRRTWIYDGRTAVPLVTKSRPLSPEHFAEFEKCFGVDPNGESRRERRQSTSDRWRSFGLNTVREAKFKFDRLRWLTEHEQIGENDLAEPEELLAQVLERLRFATNEVGALTELLRAR